MVYSLLFRYAKISIRGQLDLFLTAIIIVDVIMTLMVGRCFLLQVVLWII